MNFAEFGLFIVSLALAKKDSVGQDALPLSEYRSSTKSQRAVLRAKIAVKVRHFIVDTLNFKTAPELPDEIQTLTSTAPPSPLGHPTSAKDKTTTETPTSSTPAAAQTADKENKTKPENDDTSEYSEGYASTF